MDTLMLVVIAALVMSFFLLPLVVILAVLACIWPDAWWARVCNRPIGPSITDPTPTRDQILLVMQQWSWIGTCFSAALLASIALGFSVPMSAPVGIVWGVVLITEFMGILVSFGEVVSARRRLLDEPPAPRPQSDEDILIRSRTA